jgi:hypothetical protein
MVRSGVRQANTTNDSQLRAFHGDYLGMAIHLPHDKLQQHWAATNSGIAVWGQNESLVASLEHRYNVSLPADFRSYLCDASPMQSEAMDNSGTAWWAVGRVKNIPDEYEYEIGNGGVASEASSYLFFADYLIWCWAWAINCGNGKDRGRVVCIAGSQHDRFVADSFSEFVDIHIADHHALGPATRSNRQTD